jgi:hypothetical protein
MTTDPNRHSAAATAPHVEEDWADAFILELRLLDVHGTVIGDALAEVDSHCADSGEGARETFGDPVAYARSLALPQMEDAGWRGLVPVLVPVEVQVAGLFAVSASAGPLRHDRSVELTVGIAVGALVLVLATMALAVWADAILRAFVRRPLVASLGFGAVVLVSALPVALIGVSEPIASAPAPLVLGAGGVLLVVGCVLELRRQDDLVDPVVDPRAEPKAPRSGWERWQRWSVAIIPLWSVVLFALGWFLPGR